MNAKLKEQLARFNGNLPPKDPPNVIRITPDWDGKIMGMTREEAIAASEAKHRREQ